LGRNYIHKNTAIFPEIVDALKNTHNIIAKFFVTFTEEEWHRCSPKFKSVCVNVGPLAVAQCPSFYKSLDAVVFPSLLECFSATPLEAMAMEKPLFASDRSFNRDICGLHAYYFDPLDPASAAQSIASVFTGTCPDTVALQAAREHAINFSNSKERAEKYMALLMGDTPAKPTEAGV
jgi:glycosyltransferase involved in cell wall biosynthesis